MKSNCGPKTTTWLFIVFIGLSLSGTKVLAGNIKRSCNAHYYGMVQRINVSINGQPRTLNLPFESLNFRIDRDITAQGGCGKMVPNRCRKRARDKLLACTKAHVASPNQLPTTCGPDAFKRYQDKNLLAIIKEKTCGSLRTKDGIQISDVLPAQRQVQVLLGVHIRGKDDCGKKKPGKTTVAGRPYKIDGNKFYLQQPLRTFTITCP